MRGAGDRGVSATTRHPSEHSTFSLIRTAACVPTEFRFVILLRQPLFIQLVLDHCFGE